MDDARTLSETLQLLRKLSENTYQKALIDHAIFLQRQLVVELEILSQELIKEQETKNMISKTIRTALKV
ncbi:MAG: hypothetical protein AAF391_04370 [Bacteroidota bacterium]